MSYVIVKYISFNEKRQRVSISACSNNVYPKTYAAYDPLHGDTERYEQFKRAFAEYLFDGECQFQRASKCKAHRAFIAANNAFSVGRGVPFNAAWNRYGRESGDYQRFRDNWIETYLAFLNDLLNGKAA